MKFDIPKIVRPLRLADYAPELDGAVIQVWVNPPRGMIATYTEITRGIIQAQKDADEKRLDEFGTQLIEWMTLIWSQGDAESHWTVEEIKQLIGHAIDTDPMLWTWLTNRTVEMIGEHRSAQKKR